MTEHTLCEVVAELAAKRPNAIFARVTVSGEPPAVLTYGDLVRRASSVAAGLHGAGIRRGELVIVVLPQGEPLISSFVGASWGGAIPSIFPFPSEKLDPARYRSSVCEMVRISRASSVVASAELYEELGVMFREANLAVSLLSADVLLGNGGPYIPPESVDPDGIVLLQHSSGSTGLQKGVALSHRALLNQIAAYADSICLTADDCIVSWLPLYHDMGLIACFLMPLVVGVPLVLLSPFGWVRRPESLLHAITQWHGTLCWLPNFAYNFSATRIPDSRLGGVDLSSLRLLINCSEPAMFDSHELFAQRFVRYGLRRNALSVCYAMAENTFAVTQTPPGEPVRVDRVDRERLYGEGGAVPWEPNRREVNVLSTGRTIPGTRVRIVDRHRRDVPDRCVGEVAVKSNCMLTGYYNHPDLTREVLENGWYFTGDMGYVADGELYITGRKSDIIIVGGKNIYPQDIEYFVSNVEGVHPGRVVAFGVYSEREGTEEVVVLVESHRDRSEYPIIAERIRLAVAQHSDVVARHVEVLPPMWLAKTSSGKIARSANRQKYMDHFVQPR